MLVGDSDRVILITGSRTGIGEKLVEYYISKGLNVVGCSRNPSDFQHCNYQHFCIDVSKEEEVQSLFQNVMKTYGRLDVLINNAGTSSKNLLSHTSEKTIQNILR